MKYLAIVCCSLALRPFASALSPSLIPTVEGPITGGTRGYPFGSFFGNISSVGYQENEYFLSGIATRYSPATNLTHNGLWDVLPSNTSAYKTRILVRTPKDPSKFNGVVIVEWVNVSFGYEISFAGDTPGIYENGFAYVLVSAQVVGITGFIQQPEGLIVWDQQRYGTLSIPDDGLSYDIFSQAGRLLTDPNGQKQVLTGLKPSTVAAIGGSQSGQRILAYTNGIQKLANVYNLTMPLLTAGEASDFSSSAAQENQTSPARVFPTQVRTDLKIPVWEMNSETEGTTYFQLGNRQPDTNLFREWEITGSSHANGPILQTISQIAIRDQVPPPTIPPNPSQVNWLPVVDRFYQYIVCWVHEGIPPPSFPKMDVVLNGTSAVYVRNSDGNVEGGIRLPEETVPIASYIGFDGLSLSGETIPFSAEKLRQLYPTHQHYVNEVILAAEQSLFQGVILDVQVQQYISQANAAAIPPI